MAERNQLKETQKRRRDKIIHICFGIAFAVIFVAFGVIILLDFVNYEKVFTAVPLRSFVGAHLLLGIIAQIVLFGIYCLVEAFL